MRIAVTGANGFAGRAICQSLVRHGHEVVGVVRLNNGVPAHAQSACEMAAVADYADQDRLTGIMLKAQAVVHAAGLSAIEGRASRMRRCREQGRLLIEHAAKAARRAGVERFVLLSSIKAVGGRTDGVPFHEATPPRPADAYGNAKLEEERLARDVFGAALQIVRPPLLYGPGMKGNMLRLFMAAERGIALPIGTVENKRDVLFVGSLGEVIAACLRRPHIVLPIVTAKDGQALSTAGLYRQIAGAIGTEARFLPVPARLVEGALRWAGRGGLADSLFKSLEIDDRVTRQVLAWAPHLDGASAMAASGVWYRARDKT